MSDTLPKGWKWVKLGEIAEVVGGFAFKSQHFGEYGTPVVKIKDIKPPYIDVEELEKVDISFYNDKNLKKYYIEKDDFVLAMTGATIGKIGILKRDLKLLINQRVAKIVPKDIVNKAFIYYSINNNTFQQFIQNNIDSNSAQENISSQSIGRFPILLPPLPEQKAIAEVLSSLDDKIELLHRQNKTLEEMAMTLFRQWFIEPTKDGLPEGWEEKNLKDICVIKNGYAFKSSTYTNFGIKIIRTLNFLNHWIDLNDLVYVSEETASRYENFYLKRKDFLLVMVGASIGNFAIVTKEILPALQNQNMWCFRANKGISQHYLNYLLQHMIKETLQGSSGSAREFFQKSIFYEFKIKLPPPHLLSKFEEIVEPCFSKIELNRYQIQTLEKLRDTLLPKLMNGEVRVKF